MTSQPIENEFSATETPVSGDSGWRRLRRRLFGMVAVSLLTLLLLEGVLRTYIACRGWTPNCYAAHLDLLRPHPVNGYDLKPEFRLRSGVFNTSTNSLGLRGPEISVEKPPGVVRLAVLGGSSVFGYLVSDGDEATQHLERRLNEDGCNVEVINAGVPGYSLFHTLVRYREVVAPLEPDIVILYAGHNDLGYLCSQEPDLSEWREGRVAPGWERCLGHSSFYGFVAYRLAQRGYGYSPAIGTHFSTDPTAAGILQFEENLVAIDEAVSETGAILVVCSQATAARANVDSALRRHLGARESDVDHAKSILEEMQKTLKGYAEERDIVFLDAGAEIPPTEEFLGDAIHLTAAGEERLAGVLLDGIKPLMPNCPGAADDSADSE